jgi:2-methylisocitrate lyase-like PEP mutase family enzyme
MKKTTLLRKLLQDKNPLIAPGAFDGLSAKLIQQSGFSAVYASGGAMARSAGYPDIGLMTLTEMVDRLRLMTQVTSIPIIADADTGFGSAVNARRTAQLYEQAGVAGFHIEDQEIPKRCGHLENKGLIQSKEMCHKIEVVKNSINDNDILVIARTDAIAVEGFEKALARATDYVRAGADMIFVEAPTTKEQIEEIARKIPGPKLMNMFYGGKTPLVPISELKQMGYNLIIIPSDLQRAAIKAMQVTLKTILANGDSSAVAEQLATFQEREQIIQTEEYLKYEFSN